MVKLKHIVKTNEKITCNYFPEDGTDVGYIEVNIETQTIEKHIPTKLIGDKTYAMHAKYRLIKLLKEDVIPETSTVMWY